MSESSFQSKVLKYLKTKKVFFFKTMISNRSGIPDIIGCYKGCFFAIEVKSNKGKVSRIQKKCLAEIEEKGGRVLILREDKDKQKWIKNIENFLFR